MQSSAKIYIEHLLSTLIEKTKIKKKEAVNGPFFLKEYDIFNLKCLSLAYLGK